MTKNRSNGLKNPNVRFGADLSPGEVMGSRMMAYPITAQEIRPVCDGACALILATEEKAKKLTNKPLWIIGIGQSYDVHFLGERELAESLALEQAAKQAYEAMPYKLILEIYDGDARSVESAELIRRNLIYNFPAEYLRNGEIEPKSQQPITARFKLIPLSAETP